MILKLKKLRFLTGRPVCMIHEKTAKKMSLHVGNRVSIKNHKGRIISIVDTVSGIIKPDEIAVSEEILEILALKDKETVDVEITEHPKSISLIKKKLKGERLEKEEIDEVIKDIADNALTEAEVAFFISAVYTKGMSVNETKNLISSMVKSGNKINLKGKIVDKHCMPYETPIMVKNNEAIEFTCIGDLIERFGFKKEEFSENIEDNLQVLSWNEDFQTVFTPIRMIHKTKSPSELIKIRLKGNRDIKLTKDHTIFVLKNGKIVNIPSCEIKKGDFILVPKNLNYYKNIDEINLNIALLERKNKRINKVISINKKLMRFIGYYLSEGFSNYQGVFLNFGSHEKELIKDSIDCIRAVFGIEPTINYPHKTAIRVCIYSRELSKRLKECFLWGDSALNKSIPKFIFGLDNELKLEFIRALFDGDGYYRRGYEAVYVTVSKTLVNELAYLLSLMGMSISISTSKEHKTIFPTGEYTVSESYYVYTQAREIKGDRKKDNVSFINLFPIKETGEINKTDIGWILRKALKNQKYMTREHFKKIENNLLETDFKKLISSDFSVLEVKEAVKIKSESRFVYDISTDYGRFIAGLVPICVHNCIGGIAGNRTTPIVVSICSSTGLIMPKTSSRAITSAAGTADVIETIARVEFSIEEIKKIIKKTNACLVWGGALGLAPVDDKIIKIERLVNIDSTPQLLASILSKKISVGSKYVLIDIPCGRSAKVSKKQAVNLKEKFMQLGKMFGLKIAVVLTEGSEPIGNGIGPILEIKDVLNILKRNNGPKDLEDKSVYLAGVILELAGKAKKGHGKELARKILDSGKAFEKFQEIIKAQQGHLNHFPSPKFSYSIHSEKNAKIKHLDNKILNLIARFAGCPEDHTAGIYLNKKKNDIIKKGDIIFTIYTESQEKLNQAKKLYEKNKNKVIEFD